MGVVHNNTTGTVTFQYPQNLKTVGKYVFSNTNNLSQTDKDILLSKNSQAIGKSYEPSAGGMMLEVITYSEQTFNH